MLISLNHHLHIIPKKTKTDTADEYHCVGLFGLSVIFLGNLDQIGV